MKKVAKDRWTYLVLGPLTCCSRIWNGGTKIGKRRKGDIAAAADNLKWKMNVSCILQMVTQSIALFTVEINENDMMVTWRLNDIFYLPLWRFEKIQNT